MDLVAEFLQLDPQGLTPVQNPVLKVVDAQRAPQRGPMRPANLTSARRRMSGAALTARFRLIDVVILLAAIPLSLWVGRPDVLSAPLRSVLSPAFATMLLLWTLKACNVYAFSPRETFRGHFQKVLGTIALSIAAAFLSALLFRGGFEISVRWSTICLCSVLAAHTIEWLKVRQWRNAGRLTPNIVVVGATPNARRLIESALQAGDAAILGVFDDRMSRIPEHIHGVPVLGNTSALLTHKLLPYIDRIIITVNPTAQNRVRELIDRLKYLPNAVTLFMDVEGADAQHSTMSRLADAPLRQVSGVQADDVKANAKRLQDLIIGSLALVAASPLMVLIALAVRLDSPGPIFFRQRRFGFNSEVIGVWKFRSMRQELEDPLAAQQVCRDDCRVTRVGRFIRRFSLDELPQLFNVFKGEMSLVGPRPHAIGMKTAGEDSSGLVAGYAWRHRMKPGLTGWAQINGSIGAIDTPELVRRRVALDVEYIERQSFWFDLRILLMTLPALIRARNAVR